MLQMTAKQAAALVKNKSKKRTYYRPPNKGIVIPSNLKIEGGCKIIVPGVPPSLNRWARLNSYEQNETKRDWEHIVGYASRGAPKFIKPTIRITYFFSTNRRRDKDNYAPKFIMDGLVKAGVIIDDNTNVVNVDWDIKMDKNDKTEILITEGWRD